MNDALINSMLKAVQAAPGDLPLRLHLAELLVAADRRDEAADQLAAVLAADPGNHRARSLMEDTAFRFDWNKAEADLRDNPDAAVLDRPNLTLADVGGLTGVKSRLAAELPAGMRPDGGLILYGPPGCGKRFLARAVAGELGATFVSVSLADDFDMWLARGEHTVRAGFELARRSAPAVLFLDELDAIGRQRGQLLTELDADHDEGVFVLAATDFPWNVDAALRQPGRLDRAVLVLPPDAAAREAILRLHLNERVLAEVDIGRLAARTEGMTGADLADVCETAAERAIMDSAVSGVIRLIEMRDLNAALAEIRPSARIWFDIARREAGDWDELARYLREVQ